MENQESEKTYSSGEAAKKLGISVQSLKRHRLLGDIEGTRVGTSNVYVYTEAQLKKAIEGGTLKPKKPGQRRKKDSDEESHAAVQPWDLPVAGKLARAV